MVIYLAQDVIEELNKRVPALKDRGAAKQLRALLGLDPDRVHKSVDRTKELRRGAYKYDVGDLAVGAWRLFDWDYYSASRSKIVRRNIANVLKSVNNAQGKFGKFFMGEALPQGIKITRIK